jgi:uncharacterized RDD family membrane protein YckC
MGSAQLDFVAEAGTGTDEPKPSALRQQVAERLAAHRQRRERQGALESALATAQENPKAPKHRIAAEVAERFAHTPSYRAFLAEQAKRAIHEAAAAAEVAMRNAEAVAAAQQELLGELELWNAPQEFTPETAIVASPPSAPKRLADPPARPGGLTVRLYEDLRDVPGAARPPAATEAHPGSRIAELDAAEALALDEEIAFRQAPVFDDYWLTEEPPVPLPANLLEFPRQLVAARKARPRLAEGPLREEITPRTAQLRIFEVEPEQISTAPMPVPAAPEWTSIRLDAHSVTEPHTPVDTVATPLLASLLPPQTAPFSLRAMSALVDGLLVMAGAVASVAAFARFAREIPLGLPAVLAGVGLLVAMHIIYQLLFFSLSDQTPGMRYARIGFCTFSDENPTRKAMRRRLLAQFLAICPLGLGIVWIFLDDDGLGWHDRISKMYQRAY